MRRQRDRNLQTAGGADRAESEPARPPYAQHANGVGGHIWADILAIRGRRHASSRPCLPRCYARWPLGFRPPPVRSTTPGSRALLVQRPVTGARRREAAPTPCCRSWPAMPAWYLNKWRSTTTAAGRPVPEMDPFSDEEVRRSSRRGRGVFAAQTARGVAEQGPTSRPSSTPHGDRRPGAGLPRQDGRATSEGHARTSRASRPLLLQTR